jgi:hypothetical protein
MPNERHCREVAWKGRIPRKILVNRKRMTMKMKVLI